MDQNKTHQPSRGIAAAINWMCKGLFAKKPRDVIFKDEAIAVECRHGY